MLKREILKLFLVDSYDAETLISLPYLLDTFGLYTMSTFYGISVKRG